MLVSGALARGNSKMGPVWSKFCIWHIVRPSEDISYFAIRKGPSATIHRACSAAAFDGTGRSCCVRRIFRSSSLSSMDSVAILTMTVNIYCERFFPIFGVFGRLTVFIDDMAVQNCVLWSGITSSANIN